ncbi:MAG TPA: peptidoglycan DD-metalloendopeptidase family protein [Thermoanaerobaculia bacterium]|nr:peptidoglycan DD-metalloendopeptidase family protein [Thermoanaerobaculia bacterium]
MKILRALGERLGGVVRRPRAYVAIAIPVAIPLFLAAVRSQPEFGAVAPASAVISPQLRYDALSEPLRSDLPQHSLILTVEANDTLDGVLQAGGLNRIESNLLTQELGKSIDVRRLRPGHMLRFHYDESGRVDSVQMKVNGWGALNALRGDIGFTVEARPGTVRELETTVAARIDSSLYEAVREAGEGPQLVQQLVDVFQWDIDFFELNKGDEFSLVVRKRYAGGDLVGYGPIEAARFTHKGTMYEAFRHESADGRAGYYAHTGRPLRKQFLRAPLKFTHITSGFSKRRFHPVLKYFRPHHGVDYGAPVGTPVMTTADGVVMEAHYKGGEGNFVRIRHTSRIETSYLHLSRFAKGIKPGAKVTQGDVIGYVGMTGLATGPHLDYRVSDGGTWLDPLTLKSITPDPLGGDSLRRFRVRVVALLPRLAQAPPEAVAQNRAPRRALF